MTSAELRGYRTDGFRYLLDSTELWARSYAQYLALVTLLNRGASLAEGLATMRTEPAAPAERKQLVAQLRAEGVTDPRLLAHVLRSLQSGGEKEVLSGEARDEAVRRLMRHYDWDERTAEWTISLSEGGSDVVPVDDDGTELPYFRVRDELEADGETEEDAGRP